MMVGVCCIHQAMAGLLNSFVIADWIEFGVLQTFLNFILFSLFFFRGKNQDEMQIEAHYHFRLLWDCLRSQVVTLIAFAVNEKIRKELYVVLITNAKTKKQLMGFYNQTQASCIVSKDGSILLCNTNFNQLLRNNFDIKSTPKNIFKILLTDQAAK